MSGCYYNEIEAYAADWLENLIRAGHIAAGDVDRRSIVEVHPDDLRSYSQCHFFAGIGGWSYALRLAGWPDDRPVWTGSCPCQPFSSAGKQSGSEDERHLWPAFFRLIRERRPTAVFGEQVAGAAGLAWLDHVCADLEGEGYAVAAADLPACSVGAPHRRQRLWWVADTEQRAAERLGFDMAGAANCAEGEARERQRVRDESRTGSDAIALANTDERGHNGSGSRGARGDQPQNGDELGDADNARLEGRRNDTGKHAGQLAAGPASLDGLVNAAGGRQQASLQQPDDSQAEAGEREAIEHRVRISSNPWADLEWLDCSDGKARPTQPSLFPLAHGIPGRVGRLRAYGNAIVPQVAAEVIRAYDGCLR